MSYKYNLYESLKRIDSINNQAVIQHPIPLYDLFTANTLQMAHAFATIIAIRYQLPESIEGLDKIRYKTAVLSEVSAILMSDPSYIHVFYEMDTIIAILNTPKKVDLDSALETAAKLNALQGAINVKLNLENPHKINFGIGIEYGGVQIISIPVNDKIDFVLDGEAITKAKDYADEGLSSENTIIGSFKIYNNIKDEYKKFFSFNNDKGLYFSDVHNTTMKNWAITTKHP